MDKKLFFQAIFKFLLGIILIGLLIFLPAGTIRFVNGWIFMGVLFIPMLIAGIIMMIKNPKLLKSRLDVKEKQKEQEETMKKKIIVSISALICMSCLLGMIDFLLDTWETRNLFRKVLGGMALMGWVCITYNMITLKYKWLRKLAE